jgi:RimJ/RimL family protein N-acetyltransferase
VHVFLETERMWLRRFTRDDAEVLLRLDEDPLVRTYVEDGEPVTLEEAKNTIEHFLAYYERPEVFGFWAAVEKSTGAFLGWFHFRPHDRANGQEPELGYRLVSECWGKGYATEGSRALIDMGFTTADITRVVAQTMAVHAASRRVLEKCGLRLARTFHADWPIRIPGDEHGDVEYAVTRDEWQAQRATQWA